MERGMGTDNSVIPVAAPQAMLKTVKTSRARRIINLMPKMSLNLA